MTTAGFDADAIVRNVLVPYDGEARYAYVDALGESLADAVAHFTRHGRFDLSLSEIFHMDYVPAELHVGGAASLRSDLVPLVVPVRDGVPLVVAAAHSQDDCLRLMSMFGFEREGYELVAAGLKLGS